MGLDITAYEAIKPWPHPIEDEDDFDENDALRVYTDSSFRTRLGSLTEGWYQSLGETHGFRAGSYSGYNRWRETLCDFALGVEPGFVWSRQIEYAGLPFYELINFSDCVGTLGPEVCAKLARDFADHRDTMAEASEGDETFWFLYGEWDKAFALAANGGCVVFH
jgi:hypothetical protein